MTAPLAVIAHESRRPRLQLRVSDKQASSVLDQDTLVVGYMADEQRVPIDRLAPADRLRAAENNLAGQPATAGGWTLVGRHDGEVVLRTDAFGTRPVFWRRSAERTEIHEDVWPLAMGSRLDPIGVADMLLFGHHLGNRTLFDGVCCAIGNSRVTFGRDVRQQFFDWPAPTPTGPSLEEAADGLMDALDRLYEPYAHLGGLLVPLSGGLDSRTLLALAVDKGIPVEAWTFVMRDGTREEALARDVAQRLGVPHTVSPVAPARLPDLAPGMVRATSGQLSLEHANVFGAHTSAPATYPVSVNGIYGDLLCGGSYLGPSGLDAEGAYERFLGGLTRGVALSEFQRRLPGVAGWSERAQELAREWFARVGNDPRRADLIVLANRPSRFNVWGSIATRESFDYITPFLDERLVRIAYGMPEGWQRDSRAYKLAISRRWPELAKIPWAKTDLPLAGSRPRMLGHRIARRIRRRPREFTHPSIYEEALAGVVTTALSELRAPLAEAGIDLAGLCADHPAGSPVGTGLRLRAATVFLAFKEAGFSFP